MWHYLFIYFCGFHFLEALGNGLGLSIGIANWDLTDEEKFDDDNLGTPVISDVIRILGIICNIRL